MLHPQAFLLEECKNVRRLLRNTLRYAYSSKSIEDVYVECLSRLGLIQSRISRAKPAEAEKLNELANQLSSLGELIGRIERSHIEEFSWPVANALQELAGRVCGGGKQAAKSDAIPLFFISAEDELFSYEIETEQDNPGFVVRPLFNIVFPRSLKNFVLLHTILAHEIGHAAYAIPELGAALDDEVIKVLIAGSALEDRTEFEKWLSSSGQELEPDEIDYALMLWPEELFCDLFGLLLAGPSFVAASNTLLAPFDSKSLSASHPDSLTRYWMGHEVVKHLEWERVAIGNRRALRQPVRSYFETLAKIGGNVPPRMRLLRSAQVRKAADRLAGKLGTMASALFMMPDPASLEAMVERLLRARPPVESNVSGRLVITNDQVDFRSILFAGWLAWSSKRRDDSELDFFKLNLLCDRGVLQQAAVDRYSIWRTSSERHDVRP